MINRANDSEFSQEDSIHGDSFQSPQLQQTEAMLRQYERMVASTPDGIALVDRNYRYRLVNPSILNYTQRQQNEVIGHTMAEIFGEDWFQSSLKPKLDRCLEGETIRFETWVQYSENIHHFSGVTYAPYTEPDGTISGVVITCRDLSERQEQEAIIRNIALGVSAETGAAFFQSLVQYLTQALQVEFAIIGEVIQLQPTRIRVIAGYGDGEPIDNFEYDVSGNPCETVVAKTLKIYTQGLRQHFPNTKILSIWGIESYVGIPLFDSAGSSHGILAVLSRKVLTDTRLLEEILTIFAARASAELERQKAEITLREQHQRSQQQAQREQMFNRLVQAIRQSLDLKIIFRTATTAIAQLLQTERAVISQYLPDCLCWKYQDEYLSDSTLPSKNGLEIPDIDNPFSERLKRLEVVSVCDTKILDDPINQELARMVPGAWLLVPLVVGGSVWGALTVGTNGKPRQWSQDDIKMAQAVADQVSIAIQQAKLYQQAQSELAERQRAEIALQQLNQKLERRVEERTAQLLNSLQEKEVLLKEIHHRVKNNLQLISSLVNLQANASQYTSLQEAFQDSQERIRAIALIHEHLYRVQNLARVDFVTYVSHLASGLLQCSSLNQNVVELDLEIMPVELGIDLAVPCGLIINELVSNAIKHAFPENRPGRILIRFHVESAKHYTLIIQDNGVGMSQSIDIYHTNSLGLQIVGDLVAQIDGSLVIDRTQGTQFAIIFPGEQL